MELVGYERTYETPGQYSCITRTGGQDTERQTIVGYRGAQPLPSPHILIPIEDDDEERNR